MVAKVCLARALKDILPAEKALVETERTDALVDVNKDAMDRSEDMKIANSMGKVMIPESRAELSVIGMDGLLDDVDEILCANAGHQEGIVKPPTIDLESEQHEQDNDNIQLAPNPSEHSSLAVCLTSPLPKSPTQKSLEHHKKCQLLLIADNHLA